MIRVNLADRKTSTLITADSAGGTGFLSGLFSKSASSGSAASMPTETKGLMTTLALYAVILGGVYYFSDQQKTQMLEEVNAQNATIQATINGLDAELAKSQGYEAMKQGLENDERALKTKIETIQNLINERNTPPKILIALSQATPGKVWLTDFSLRDGAVRIVGSAINMDVISDFIKSLESSVYFKDVVLKGTRQVDAQSRGQATFELEARRR